MVKALKASLFSFDPAFFLQLAEGFSALPSITHTAPTTDDDRNAETDDTDARAKRAKRAKRATQDAASVLKARRAARLAALDDEDPGRVERRAKRAANAELREEREEARRMKAAMARAEAQRIVALATTPLLGVKQGRYSAAEHDMSREQWLDRRARIGWCAVTRPRNPWEATERDGAVRGAAHAATALAIEDAAIALRLSGAPRESGEVGRAARSTLAKLDAEAAKARIEAATASDASAEARTLGDLHARFVAWARALLMARREGGVYHAQVGESGGTTLHRRADAGDVERALVQRLMDPEVFAANTLLARWLMD